ncbi:MAG: hypothetical protein PVJ19_17260 [Desulfobacteraceae bacterium]
MAPARRLCSGLISPRYKAAAAGLCLALVISFRPYRACVCCTGVCFSQADGPGVLWVGAQMRKPVVPETNTTMQQIITTATIFNRRGFRLKFRAMASSSLFRSAAFEDSTG